MFASHAPTSLCLDLLLSRQAARDNEAASREAFGQDALAARRRQHAESQLLQAFRLLRSLFDRKPRVQPLDQVCSSDAAPIGQYALCE